MVSLSAYFSGSSLQGLLDAGRLAELVLILIDGLAGVHAAGSAHRVAAHHGWLSTITTLLPRQQR